METEENIVGFLSSDSYFTYEKSLQKDLIGRIFGNFIQQFAFFSSGHRANTRLLQWQPEEVLNLFQFAFYPRPSSRAVLGTHSLVPGMFVWVFYPRRSSVRYWERIHWFQVCFCECFHLCTFVQRWLRYLMNFLDNSLC